jgi:hypothetical protein
MENTKEILEFQKNRAQDVILKLAETITANGMDENSIFQCYMAIDVLHGLNAANHFFNAWHPDGKQSKNKAENE